MGFSVAVSEVAETLGGVCANEAVTQAALSEMGSCMQEIYWEMISWSTPLRNRK